MLSRRDTRGVRGRPLDPSEKEQVRESYKWAVQALALEAPVQISLFPEFSSVLEELDSDLQGAQSRFLEACGESLLQTQQEAVVALDGQLQAMGGEHNAGLWEVDALADSPEWALVRRRARELLKRFGWAQERPPEQQTIYVTGSGLE